MAPTVGSPTRRIRRRISRYVPADGTQVTGPQARKMWNYFFSRALRLYDKAIRVNTYGKHVGISAKCHRTTFYDTINILVEIGTVIC